MAGTEVPFPEELDAWREGVVQTLARKKGNGADGGSPPEEDVERALAVLEEHISMLAFSVRQLFTAVCTLFDHTKKTDKALREYIHEVRSTRKELEKARRALDGALEAASARTPWPWVIVGALGGLLGGLVVGVVAEALLF